MGYSLPQHTYIVSILLLVRLPSVLLCINLYPVWLIPFGRTENEDAFRNGELDITEGKRYQNRIISTVLKLDKEVAIALSKELVEERQVLSLKLKESMIMSSIHRLLMCAEIFFLVSDKL